MSQKSAAQRVFEVYELVEDIIKDFPAEELLQLQRLDRVVYGVINNSRFRRATLFLDPHPFFSPNILLENKIQGPPIILNSGRGLDICFSNKSQARNVLRSSRTQYSWERMYTTCPAVERMIQLTYLAEEEITLVAGATKRSWMVEKTAYLRIAPSTLGDVLKTAAKIMLEDHTAWDPAMPELDREERHTLGTATMAYLKYFDGAIDANESLDLDLPDVILTPIVYDPARLLLLRTSPLSPSLAANAATVELEWLRYSDIEPNNGFPRVLHKPSDGLSIHKSPSWVRGLQLK